MKNIWGLIAVAGVVLSACGTSGVVDESTVTSVAIEVGENKAERNEITSLVDGYPGYFTDGVNVYWDENRYNPGKISLIKLSGIGNSDLIPLHVSGSLSYRWLQHGNNLWMEDKKIDGIDLSTMNIEKDLFCGNSVFLSDSNSYYFIDHGGTVQSWDKNNMMLDGDFVEYITFGYQENNTPTSDDDTLLVFFSPDGVGKAFCKVIQIPNLGAYYQEISASWDVVGLSLRIKANSTVYEVTASGYTTIE